MKTAQIVRDWRHRARKNGRGRLDATLPVELLRRIDEWGRQRGIKRRGPILVRIFAENPDILPEALPENTEP